MKTKKIICFSIASIIYLLVNMPLAAQLSGSDKTDGKTTVNTTQGKTSGLQPISTGTATAESQKARIRQMLKRDRKALKFFDKDGKYVKEISLVGGNTEVRISKDKAFTAKGFQVKISTYVEAALEGARKRSGRDLRFFRSEGHDVAFNPNKKYVSVTDHFSDSVSFVDARDSDTPAPVDGAYITTIYDLDGNVVLKLTQEEGWNPIVSNTGQFFVVVIGDNMAQRIINRQKVVLAEIPYYSGKTYFSDNDRFIIMVEFDWTNPDMWKVSIFDTQNNKLELQKMTVHGSVFSNMEKMEISEEKREITVYHSYYHLEHVNKDTPIERVSF